MIKQAELLKQDKEFVGIIMLSGGEMSRAGQSFNAWGIRSLVAESKEYNFVNILSKDIDKFRICLLPLTSCTDCLSAIAEIPIERKSYVIAGGQGAYAIKSILPFIDACAFGRCEGQIDDIIEGAKLSNVWRKREDPRLEGKYIIRQTQRLLNLEESAGCRFKCLFCQYTYTRRLYSQSAKAYSAGAAQFGFGGIINEDHMSRMIFDHSGQYTIGIDGLSETTRQRVKKSLPNKLIYEKLREAREANFKKTISIKAFMIIGYPWESENTIIQDLDEFISIIDKIGDVKGGRLFIKLLFTPFSPEPMTPMECSAIEFYEWRNLLLPRKRLYDSKNINVYILPQIIGAARHSLRVAINRGVEHNIITMHTKAGSVLNGCEGLINASPTPYLQSVY